MKGRRLQFGQTTRRFLQITLFVIRLFEILYRCDKRYHFNVMLLSRGLLVSKMYETAKGIVLNLIDLIDTYGYVLNGARAYYTNRRYQYPIFCSLVVFYFKAD